MQLTYQIRVSLFSAIVTTLFLVSGSLFATVEEDLVTNEPAKNIDKPKRRGLLFGGPSSAEITRPASPPHKIMSQDSPEYSPPPQFQEEPESDHDQIIYKRVQPAWLRPRFSEAIQLSHDQFQSLTTIDFPFNPYLTSRLGWILASQEGPDSRSLMHGPLALIQCDLINSTVLTPQIQLGITNLFYRQERNESSESQQTAALYAAWGVDVYLTDTFSLVIQRARLFFDHALTNLNHPQDPDRSLAENQIMFRFRF